MLFRLAVASHIKGKENFIADALSRAPHRDPIPGEEEEGEDVMCIWAVITRSMTVSWQKSRGINL